MAEKIPDWALGYPKKTLYDKYDTQRSYLVDTAETPADKKNLKSDLQNLRKQYEALKKSPTLNKTFGQSIKKPAVKRPDSKPVPLPKGPARPAADSKTRRPAAPKTTKKAPSKMTPQDSAMKKILEKKYGKIYG